MLALGIVQAFLASGGAAFDEVAQYGGLSNTDPAALDDPSMIDAEYSADYAAFQKPVAWEYDWLVNDRLFDASAGSLSTHEFLMRNRLKVRQDLNRWMEFRFTYLNAGDFEEEDTRHIIEMVLGPTDSFGVSIYGEPSLFKKEDDGGVALVARHGRSSEHRLFITFMDLERGHRNRNGDRFEMGTEPHSFGIAGAVTGDPAKREFVKYSLRHDARTRWVIPERFLTHGYEKTLGTVAWRKAMWDSHACSGRIQADEKYEEQEVTDGAGALQIGSVARRRYLAMLECDFDVDGWRVVPRLGFQHRHWRMTAGDARFIDVDPQVRLRFPPVGGKTFRQGWSAAYDVIFRLVEEGADLAERPPESKPAEHRLNLKYDMLFGTRGKLSFEASVDVDEFGTTRTWEAGHTTLQVLF